MSALLWIVFAWMLLGTIYTFKMIDILRTKSNVTGLVIGNVINILACIVIAFAAVLI